MGALFVLSIKCYARNGYLLYVQSFSAVHHGALFSVIGKRQSPVYDLYCGILPWQLLWRCHAEEDESEGGPCDRLYADVCRMVHIIYAVAGEFHVDVLHLRRNLRMWKWYYLQRDRIVDAKMVSGQKGACVRTDTGNARNQRNRIFTGCKLMAYQ